VSWPTVSLGDAVFFKGGGTPSRDNDKYWNGSIPWATVKDLNSGFSLVTTQESITEEGLKSSASNLIPRGTVIIPTRMALGKAVISEVDAAINQDLKAVFPQENLDSRFLLWYFITNGSRIKAMGKGATVKGVTLDQVRALQIPLPPILEQRRIAAILDKADVLRTKRHDAIAKLDQLLQSIFLDMFGDPASNAKGWPVGTLVDLGELDRGVSRHRPRGAPELLGGKHPLIQTGDVSRSGGYIREFTATYSDIGLAQSKKWPAGTLCITIAANIAETGILTFDACFPDSVVGFTPKQTSNVEFVQELMRFLREILEERAPQVAQKNINLAILRELPIPIPPAESQHQFARIASRIESQKRTLQHHATQLDTLFASLQHRAFTGEL